MSNEDTPRGVPAIVVLCYVLGTIALAVAIVGGFIVGNSRTFIAGWSVFGGWAFGALVLYICASALGMLSRIADGIERTSPPPQPERRPDGTGSAEGWMRQTRSFE